MFSTWFVPVRLGDVFYLRFVLRLHNEDQTLLRLSPKTAVRSVGGWYALVASLRGRESKNGGTSALGRHY
jgi:hypothetical protein